MYLIDREKNKTSPLKKNTFSELKFRERDHLQEWIAKDPSLLGEELLIIQKEFRDWNDTNERLDLLALDKQGNLVIIENKLDDSGRDVTWQVIKYASYCSGLTKQDILRIFQNYLGTSDSAEEKISEFFDNKDISEIALNQGLNSQRLILVAANFRREVTSTVLWLMNYKMRIQCFKVSPFSYNDQLFLNIEQILPTKDTEDFVISVASKAQEEIEVQETLKSRHHIRLKFWEQFIMAANQVNNMFSNNSPSKENWIAKGSGISGITLNMVATGSFCRSEFTINRGSKEENKEIFDFFYKMREKIEADFGESLVWERMDDNVTCRIKYQLDGVSYFDEDNWSKMNSFLIDASTRMERAFKDPIKSLSNVVRSK